ncbi:hypothetical protein TSMEX_006166 [Taenia solium]|eukprot:TsM_000219700 transcript=TsM_000219700 gene=TsM_000219700
MLAKSIGTHVIVSAISTGFITSLDILIVINVAIRKYVGCFFLIVF